MSVERCSTDKGSTMSYCTCSKILAQKYCIVGYFRGRNFHELAKMKISQGKLSWMNLPIHMGVAIEQFHLSYNTRRRNHC